MNITERSNDRMITPVTPPELVDAIEAWLDSPCMAGSAKPWRDVTAADLDAMMREAIKRGWLFKTVEAELDLSEHLKLANAKYVGELRFTSMPDPRLMVEVTA